MPNLIFSTRFKKDFKLCHKQGKDISKIQAVFDIFLEGKPLPSQYQDHPLSGNWRGFRDLHIEPDWLLVYYIKDGDIYLAATGTHSYVLDI